MEKAGAKCAGLFLLRGGTMSKITNIIFNDPNGAKHYLTSNMGARASMNTSAGKTASYHSGCDYGTNGVKLPQYAIEAGYVFAAAKASDGANYVWVIYPRIKAAFLHYHLDSYCVKAGQKVAKGTKLGITGQTGKATGVHLHLGYKPLYSLSSARINNMTWDALRGIDYKSAENYAKSYTTLFTRPSYALSKDKHGYKKGRSANVGVKWLQFQLQRLGYYSDKIDGWYGAKTESAVKAFQKASGLTVDGKAYNKTFDCIERK